MENAEARFTEQEVMHLLIQRSAHFDKVFQTELLKFVQESDATLPDPMFQNSSEVLIRQALGRVSDNPVTDLIVEVARITQAAMLETVYHPGFPSGIEIPEDPVNLA